MNDDRIWEHPTRRVRLRLPAGQRRGDFDKGFIAAVAWVMQGNFSPESVPRSYCQKELVRYKRAERELDS